MLTYSTPVNYISIPLKITSEELSLNRVGSGDSTGSLGNDNIDLWYDKSAGSLPKPEGGYIHRFVGPAAERTADQPGNLSLVLLVSITYTVLLIRRS